MDLLCWVDLNEHTFALPWIERFVGTLRIYCMNNRAIGGECNIMLHHNHEIQHQILDFDAENLKIGIAASNGLTLTTIRDPNASATQCSTKA